MTENKIHNTTGEMMREIIGDALRMQVPPGCEPAGPGAISAWVAGVPAPQGSKRALGAGRPGGKIRMVEASTRVKPWRTDVREAFLAAQAEHPERGELGPLFGSGTPVVVKIVFVLPRTKAMRDRPSADFPMVQKPDVDKLERAVLDALTSAGVFADDSQVVASHKFKRRGEPGEPTGAMIHVEPYLSAMTRIAMAPDAGMPVREYELPVPVVMPYRHALWCPARQRDVVCRCGPDGR